ncbi:hypothetical protein MMC30_004167 [Trapelia coarctata]|nr:hypothetical protein [Trapelia coarctata]
MSSMRNAVQRRNHKERAQPLERQKWGVLEKHKDYSLRAADYNAKKARLKALRQKAAERNPDEFHFAMMSSKTDNHGRKITDRGNKALSTDTVKLLKTQDAAYLRTMGQKTRRAREKVEMEYVLGDGVGKINVVGGGSRKAAEKIVFVGTKEEQREYALNGKKAEPGKRDLEDIDPEDMMMDGQEGVEDGADDLPPLQPKQSKALLEAQESAQRERRALRKQHKREQEARRSKLEALKTRERELFAAEQELEIQRAKMSNSVGGVTKTGLKWKVRERKR